MFHLRDHGGRAERHLLEVICAFEHDGDALLELLVVIRSNRLCVRVTNVPGILKGQQAHDRRNRHVSGPFLRRENGPLRR